MSDGKILPAWSEADRLAALASYGIMDTPKESDFDDIVKVAAQICGVPMALISLVDSERQWFKAAVGLGAPETPRDIAFCAHAIQQTGQFTVEDATQDARFQQNPLVTGDPNLRFYAGEPLETPDGLPLGTLCVLDTKPRVLDENQSFALKALARQVMVQLELRKALAERHEAETRHRLILKSAIDYAIISMDLSGRITGWNAGAETILGWSEAEMLGEPCHVFFTPEDCAAGIPEKELEGALLTGMASDERWHCRKDQSQFWASGEMMMLRADDGRPIGTVKILRDRTAERLASERRDLLVQEQTHRIKNILAIVQAVVSQSLRHATSMTEAQTAIGRRLRALSDAQDLLTSMARSVAPLNDVIHAAIVGSGIEPGRFQAGGPSFVLGPKSAVAVALALHELITNALKYGALSLDAGHVTLTWSTGMRNDSQWFTLVWTETGGPTVTPPDRTGFGTRLIHSLLPSRNGAKMVFDYRPEGLVWTLEGPVDGLSAA